VPEALKRWSACRDSVKELIDKLYPNGNDQFILVNLLRAISVEDLLIYGVDDEQGELGIFVGKIGLDASGVRSFILYGMFNTTERVAPASVYEEGMTQLKDIARGFGCTDISGYLLNESFAKHFVKKFDGKLYYYAVFEI
jgi:hypothetical protein